MTDFRKIGKDDPEPWKPNEVEYALYDDIDRSEIKGYDDDTDVDSESPTPTPTESDTDEDGTSSVASSTTLRKKKKSRWTSTSTSTSSFTVQYANILQEDNDFVSE